MVKPYKAKTKNKTHSGVVCPACNYDDGEVFQVTAATRRYSVFVCRRCAHMWDRKVSP